MRALLLLSVLSFSYSFLQAQTLRRKAALSAIIEPTANGIKVLETLGGTAQDLQLKEGDLIQEMNQTPITDYPALHRLLDSKREGDLAQCKVLREGKLISLSGKYFGRSSEKAPFSTLIYDQVAFKGGQLRVIINKPEKKGKLPAMLFIPGYTCTSIDNLSDNHPYKRFIDAYTQAGFVTLRIEKSGLGDSEQTPNCESCDLKDEIENFEAGLKKLKSLPYVDTNYIFIVGHSMGGIVAPALSAKNTVAGVIVYGTTAKSWFEYQIEMYRVQHLLAGMEPLEYEKSITDQYELNYRFFIQKESLSDLAKNPKLDSLLKQQWMYDGQGMIYGRNAEYWRQIQDLPHLENWKNTKAKVLVQFGESDFQAFSKADHEQIVRTVNYYHPGHATLQTFPLTDHYYAKSGSMQEAFNKFSQQQFVQLFDAFNFEVTRSAVDWSLNLIHPSTTSTSTTASWKKLKTEPYPGKQDDIYFINEKIGWYINGYGSLYQTKDGGENWEKIFEKKGSFFRTIAFLDENIGFLGTVGTDYFPNVSDTIPLYQTKDGGKTWQAVEYSGPYVKGLCAIDIVKETYINHGQTDYRYHIYAVGRVGSPANMIVSHDGGKTWTSKPMNQDCKMLFDVKMLDKNKGFACAASHEDLSQSNALILKTKDAGQTWTKVYQSSRPFETTWKISFPTEQIGYASIQSYNPDTNIKQQRIVKTTNGGDSWTELNLIEDHAARPFGIGFLDEQQGFVGTTNSGFETRDGGQTWTAVELGRACNKIRFYRQGTKVYGYAIGLGVFKW